MPWRWRHVYPALGAPQRVTARARSPSQAPARYRDGLPRSRTTGSRTEDPPAGVGQAKPKRGKERCLATSRHRAATPDDAPALADFVESASEGWPCGSGASLPSGTGTPGLLVASGSGGRRAGSPTARLRPRTGGSVAAGLILSPPRQSHRHSPATMPNLFVPLQELENLAPANWYVSAGRLSRAPRKGLGNGAPGARPGIAPKSGRPASASSSPTPIARTPTLRAQRLPRGWPAPDAEETWINPGTHWLLM